MYIREYKQTNKKTGKVYVNHKLVVGVRTDKGPRQRVIMTLGTLTLPRERWKQLAAELEYRITGQQTLSEARDADLELLALKLVSTKDLAKCLEALNEPGLQQSDSMSESSTDAIKDLTGCLVSETGPQKSEVQETSHPTDITINLGSIKLQKARTLGAEVLCKKTWDLLGLTGILKDLGLTDTSISLAMAIVFGRMIAPSSELKTIRWFRNKSALQELDGVSDLSRCGKDRYYNVADTLYAHKETIEDRLFQKERAYFPHTESTVYLYDVTNTYLEGRGLRNALAAHGHCKSKRTDCPLITLSLVVDGDRMPICSQIYKGNQSEPVTMEGMMKRLSARLSNGQIPLFKPTVIMDRGIATAGNVKWLDVNGYHYAVIQRRNGCRDYQRQFREERDKFELVSSKTSPYGDENSVYVRKELVNGGLCRVLCISEGKERKEQAIAAKKANPFLEAVENLRKSIEAGTIKKPDKIKAKLERLFAKYPKLQARYVVNLEKSETQVTEISLVEKIAKKTESLHGCYVIESTHVDRSAQEIWRMYMSLTRVESAFRSMKETLGMRPIYHQTGDRSAAHLFLTVLAYHLLATIENLMKQQGDPRTWAELRDAMSDLVRGGVAMKTDLGSTYNLRVSGEPEENQQTILNKLNVRSLPKMIVSKN